MDNHFERRMDMDSREWPCDTAWENWYDEQAELLRCGDNRTIGELEKRLAEYHHADTEGDISPLQNTGDLIE